MVNLTIENESEFSIMVADLIKELSELDDVILKIWTIYSELPIKIDCRNCNLHFMSEGIKVMYEQSFNYILFDSVQNVMLIFGERSLEWERIT